ncbi:MAG: sensor histidine kinase [Syntrophothermus sp.]
MMNEKLKQQPESLEDREFWLNESQRVARIGHYRVNIKTGVWTSSPMLDELIGIDTAFRKDVNSWANSIHPDDRKEMLEYRESVLREKKQFNREYRIYRQNDSALVWLHEVGNLSFDENGEPESMFGTIQDITQRKNAEEALKTSDQFMKTVIDAMPDIVCFKDGKGRWLLANHFDLQLFQLEGVDYAGKTDADLAAYSPFYREAFLQCGETDEQAWKNGTISRCDETIPVPDGPAKTFDILKVPLFTPEGERKGLIVIGRDITERQQFESALKESLKEKEILLKEIHHRVKNNLQIISSLLSLQNDSISLENFRKSINDSRTRIRTMAMIHEKLYRTSNFASLEFGDYVTDLINYLYHTYNPEQGKIEIKEDYNKIVLPLDMAIPMGLIINELVSNVFKYAFPGNVCGCLSVCMQLKNDQLSMVIKDNGVGIPEGTDTENTATLGLVMVRNLVQQLKGSFEIVSAGGVECIITVPLRDQTVQ